jgi:hypothetical protein
MWNTWPGSRGPVESHSVDVAVGPVRRELARRQIALVHPRVKARVLGDDRLGQRRLPGNIRGRWTGSAKCGIHAPQSSRHAACRDEAISWSGFTRDPSGASSSSLDGGSCHATVQRCDCHFPRNLVLIRAASRSAPSLGRPENSAFWSEALIESLVFPSKATAGGVRTRSARISTIRS